MEIEAAAGLEYEFEQWFSSTKETEHEKELKAKQRGEEKDELAKEQRKKDKKAQIAKDELNERVRVLWSKVRNWVFRMGAKKLHDRLVEGYKRALEEEAKTDKDPLIIEADLRPDPDGFGWTWLSKDDLNAKMFLEETVPSATSAALELILRHFAGVFNEE
ncbi:hypothetical protein HDU98_005234 [Podochytrium sp. JEL0797]|nr:hypothetical protein HDU98_005234 [Podochytrium sp. JEL0797]